MDIQKQVYNVQKMNKCQLSTTKDLLEINESQPKNQCKYIQPKSKTKILSLQCAKNIFLPLQLIQIIVNCQAYKSNYLLFHVPFTYLCCLILNLYDGQQRNLFVSDLLNDEIKKLSHLSKVEPLQFEQAEIMDVIVMALNRRKYIFNQQFFSQKVGEWIKKYEARMKNLSMFYYEMFIFIANRQNLMKQSASLAELKKIFENKRKEISKKYNTQ